MVSLPFLVFSQQEEPKRVSIVINAKEIKSEKEIVQLPPNNLPLTVKVSPYKPHAKAVSSPTKKIAQPPHNTLKENAVSKNRDIAVAKNKPIPKGPNATAKPTPIKKAEIAQKPTSSASSLAEKNSVQKNTAPTSTIPKVSVSKKGKKIGEETATVLKLKTDTGEILKVTHSSKVNSFSYIWIGIFLVVAGIVLGLLFGKPAFLVSFVGIVFITLGLII